VLITNGENPESGPHTLTFGGREAARLGGPYDLKFRLIHNYRVVAAEGERGPWKVSTAGWWYTLTDGDQHELLAFHWHPDDHGPITWPHLHLPGYLHLPGCDRPADLTKAHVPTGRVSIESVLRLAIDHFGAEPLPERIQTWRGTFADTERSFEQWRTWG
jgi:hypothetical protein